MDKPKCLSEFDRGQVVMALRLGQSVSHVVDLVGCSESAVQDVLKEMSAEQGDVVPDQKVAVEKKGRSRSRKNTQT